MNGVREKIRFGTFNVCTLRENQKLAQVCSEFQRYNFGFLGLCEVRRKGAGEYETPTGELLLYSGMMNTHHRGVGLLLSNYFRMCLLYFCAVSERILVARFSAYPQNVTVVQVYAPTNHARNAGESDDFYVLLSETLDEIPHGDIIILMGDLNAKVGSDNFGWESAMGTCGLGRMNSNGHRFAELCVGHDLIIGGTIFPHKQSHKYTWTKRPGRYETNPVLVQNQIDHIAVSRTSIKSLYDVRTRRGFDVSSDHELLEGWMRLEMCPE